MHFEWIKGSSETTEIALAMIADVSYANYCYLLSPDNVMFAVS